MIVLLGLLLYLIYTKYMSILSRIVKLFGCASGPSRLEQEQEYMRIEADMKKRRENRPELLKKRIALITEGEPQGTSDSKILPTSDVKRQAPLARNTGVNVFAEAFKKATQIPANHNKGQAPLPPINTVNNKRQAPRPPINVFVKAYKEAAENQTSKADQTASTLLG